MQTTYPHTRRWTRVEYGRLIDKGMFQPGERLELLAGNLVVREPQDDPHTLAVELVNEALRTAFGPEWRVRVQLAIALDEDSEPEPDVTVTAGEPRDFLLSHPALPVLVVEVAESSLALDREEKGSLYARAHVPEYWIVNLVDRVLEVHREPGLDAGAQYGWAYRVLLTLRADEHVSPLAAPSTRILVADFLP